MQWLSIEQLAAAWKCSIRHAKRRMAAEPPAAGLVKSQPNPTGRGRPNLQYHISILGESPAVPLEGKPLVSRPDSASAQDPSLICDNLRLRINSEPTSDTRHPTPTHSSSASASALLAPDDLALAQFRVEAVQHYEQLRAGGHPEIEAAQITCAAIAAHPKTRRVDVTERLPGGYQRKAPKHVSLSAVSPSTLRAWAAIYNKSGRSLTALVLSRKSRAGRPRKPLPGHLVKRAYAWSIKNTRGDMLKALRALGAEYPGDLPAVSAATWRRRVREFDPERYMRTISTRGISEFRARHSPDVEMDYSKMEYNDLWQLDDVTMDFYGYSWNLQRMLRPFAYAIIRVATRQWIACVTCERQITQEQVRQLVGFALADPRGGIPRAIKFERGTVACDTYLERLLQSLGIKVLRTSMDGGAIHQRAVPDRASGHFQGKGVIERAFRELHNIGWDNELQVGTNERYDSAANLETLKREMLAAAKAGRPIRKLTPQEWQAAVVAACELYNNRPHGAHPEILDPETSTEETLRYRHMTPNEYAASLNLEQVRVLDQALLQAFIQKGLLLPVTKNGFTINNFSYGRFDPDLHAYAGKKVMVYACAECPQLAYVHELGRCVEAWSNRDARAPGDAYSQKRGIEKAKRNRYEQLIAEVLESGSNAVLDHMQLLNNPTAAAAQVETVTNPEIADRLDQQRAGIAAFRDSARKSAARFDMPTAAARSEVGRSVPGEPSASAPPICDNLRNLRISSPPRRPGLLSRERDLTDQLAALGGIESSVPSVPFS